MSVEDVWADDFMDRKPSAEFLTTYLLKNPHVKVLNVNSPWGAGKSFFLERWARMLSAKHVCVRFNAWETDYSAEPLVALITCIEEQLTDPAALESTKVGKSIINTGSMLIKKAGPLILKGLVKKFSGVELDELLVSGAEDTVDGVVEALVRDQSETKENVREFKEEVRSRLEQAALDKNLAAPAFIFIDELDRCRPTYAIELLERIKHFFELEDCRFIIASDSVQLAHSIRAVYGQGFASERYLNRFFDAEFNLDNEDLFTLVCNVLPEINSANLGIHVDGVHSRSGYFQGREQVVYPRADTVICKMPGYTENALIIVGLARYFEVALREVVSYVRQIKSAADTIGEDVDFFWLAFLVFYKNSKSESYGVFQDKVNGLSALKKFDEMRSVGVSFSFVYSIETVAEVAGFYWSLYSADNSKLRSMYNELNDWKSEVCRRCLNESERLVGYRKVVDLAYRLK